MTPEEIACSQIDPSQALPHKRVVTIEVDADLKLVLEAYDFGQFSHDMLGGSLTGGLSRGLSEPVRQALCRLLDRLSK